MNAAASCPGIPAGLDAWIAAGAGALQATRAAGTWSPRTRQAALSAIDRMQGMLTAARGQILTAEREAGTWSLRGDRDFATWVGRTSRQGRGGGFAQVGQAATLAAMPAVEQALVDGPVTPGHVQQLTRATAGSPSLAAQLATPEGQAEVVRLAGKLDAGHFGRTLAQRSARLDPASRQRAHDEQRRARFLNLTHTPGGTLVKGQLDSVAGSLFQRAVDALNPQPAADDDRDRGQRQADALTAMSQRILADQTTIPGSVAPPQVTLIMREETWAALRAPRPAKGDGGGKTANSGTTTSSGTTAVGRPVHEPGFGSTADVVARLRGVAPVTDEDGSIWPASEIARALCDCELTRVVMAAPGVVLDQGRSKRLFTPAQRRAMIARDGGGCAVPGCSMPARYTQLHHTTWWSRDGKTNLDNGIQACDRCHHRIHDQDIHITRNAAGQLVFTYPDGRLLPGSAPPDASPQGRPRPPSDPNGAQRHTPSGTSAAEPHPHPDRSAAQPGPPSDPNEAQPRLPSGAGEAEPRSEPPQV